MTACSLDYETRSTVDLRKAGAHRYAEDPSTDILCAAYAFDDDPVQTWRPGTSAPPRLAAHVIAGGTISAYNANFERLIWNHIAGPRYGWPVPALEQFDDTAAAAAAMALPRALGDCAAALGLAEQKDDAGHRLMLQMSKPRRARKGEDPDALHWWDDEERMARLVAYCAQDVETERAVRRFLLPLSEAERRVWLFDAKMNDRGVPIDLDLVHALLRIIEQASGLLDRQITEATGGWVTACSQVGRLTEWLQREGVPATSLAKAALEELLAYDDLPDHARRAIEIRQAAAKTSTKKLHAMLACVSADGRARGQHLYHGASTGRWSGRLIQVQNMPRGTGTVKDPEAAAPIFLEGSAALIELAYGNVMSAVSDMLRACFTTR